MSTAESLQLMLRPAQALSAAAADVNPNGNGSSQSPFRLLYLGTLIGTATTITITK